MIRLVAVVVCVHYSAAEQGVKLSEDCQDPEVIVLVVVYYCSIMPFHGMCI